MPRNLHVDPEGLELGIPVSVYRDDAATQARYTDPLTEEERKKLAEFGLGFNPVIGTGLSARDFIASPGPWTGVVLLLSAFGLRNFANAGRAGGSLLRGSRYRRSVGGFAHIGGSADDCEKTVKLYHGSKNFQGEIFDLDLATMNQRSGTPFPGVHLTDDLPRAAQGYGRGGVVVSTEVSESFAASIKGLGGPNHNQVEFVAQTYEQVQMLNKHVNKLPSDQAFLQWLKGNF